ncbi:hypothetical protein SAMN02745248_02200 [Hathewaya proteolytica DSM 3090]|uniref:Uncharacterized protein n=1 Tax=Hathewaya proteolytica DSM 3090 TaxID=1121331 RepID=A0A1M6R4K9_9CLOT|nr:hypothetical protein [Hathewaya proteolytica]SHK27409.1 hypothetical protein SAMN02745248_02200 [Hathewaya proteolytica DSM 3090]
MNEINTYIRQGYELLNEDNVKSACQQWLKAWDKLIYHIDNTKVTSIEELEENFEEGVEELSNWVQDLEMELENAGLEDHSFFEKRASYSREFCNKLPESDDFIIMSMKLAEAESYFELESMDKSQEIFQETQSQYSESVWPYLKWGDVYWLSSILREKPQYINIAKSMQLYKNGLGKESDMDYVLEDRICDLKKVKKNM